MEAPGVYLLLKRLCVLSIATVKTDTPHTPHIVIETTNTSRPCWKVNALNFVEVQVRCWSLPNMVVCLWKSPAAFKSTTWQHIMMEWRGVNTNGYPECSHFTGWSDWLCSRIARETATVKSLLMMMLSFSQLLVASWRPNHWEVVFHQECCLENNNDLAQTGWQAGGRSHGYPLELPRSYRCASIRGPKEFLEASFTWLVQ